MFRPTLVLLWCFAIMTAFATGITQANAAPPGTIDVKAALAPRTLGDPNAPVKLEEFASLTCTYCATFSKDTFEKLKTAYFDTGKVFYTYTDFPLCLKAGVLQFCDGSDNGPALEAAMVARCLPPDDYFEFVQLLFDTQDKWALSDNYEDSLRRSAGQMGMSGDVFATCINNQELKQGLIDRMQAAKRNSHIVGTPSFVFSNGEMIHKTDFASFEKVLDTISPEVQQQFDHVVRTYRAAAKKPDLPEEARKFKVQAESAVRDKQFDEAVGLYARALNVAPWWPEGHFNRALLLAETDAYADAITEMKRYLLLVPDASDAREAQDKVYEWERKGR